jgi:hypothetical protein
MKKINLLLLSLFLVFSINLSFAQFLYPGSDTCGTAVSIPIGEGFETRDDGPGSDHWYSFIAPCDGDLTLTNGDNNSDKRILSGVCESLAIEV